MTWQEFEGLPWEFTGHLAMEDEHYLAYTATAHGHRFGMCHHTPTERCKMEHPHARCYTHWRIDTTIYKRKKDILAALDALK